MMLVSAAIGLDRLGGWLRPSALSLRGPYEDRDPMSGAGRIADWIETSCLFGRDETISRNDVIGHLNESGVMSERVPRDLVEVIVENGFAEIARRQSLCPIGTPFGVPLLIEDMVIRRTVASWRDVPLYGFLLIASMGQLSPALLRTSTSYDEAGHLFEEIVGNACAGLFGGEAAVLGTNGPNEKRLLARRVASLLAPFMRETVPLIESAPRRVKDGGLDVVAALHIGDRRPAMTHFLVQCGVGDNWRGKLGTPALAKWRDWVRWRGPIYKAFAVPTLFVDDEALEDASKDGEWTLVLDRSRLLYGLARNRALPVSLVARVTNWLKGRGAVLREQGLDVAP